MQVSGEIPFKSQRSFSGVCVRCLEKVNNIVPNGGLMMVYHGTIRQKKSPSTNPNFRVPIFSKTNISLPMKIGCFNAPKGNDCIIPTIHFQVLLLMDKIRRSPVDKHFMYHYLQGVYTSQVVVWEFFHQQHVSSREDNFQKEENSTSHRPSRFHRPVFFGN